MRVFLSWSGKRSRAVAAGIQRFSPSGHECRRAVDFPGHRKRRALATELARHLEQSRLAIICLTAEASHSPWLLFEAGVLFNGIGQGAVCPYLVDLPTEDLTGPLAREGVKQIV